MKQYRITPVLRTMSFGDLSVVVLGERGKGTYEAIIPYGANIKKEDCVKIVRSKRGNPKVVKSSKDKDYLAVIDCDGTPGNTYGTVFVPTFQQDNVIVIAKGSGTYSRYFNGGKWNEFLLHIKDWTYILVSLTGGEKYWIYFKPSSPVTIDYYELHKYVDDLNLFGTLKNIENDKNENLGVSR